MRHTFISLLAIACVVGCGNPNKDDDDDDAWEDEEAGSNEWGAPGGGAAGSGSNQGGNPNTDTGTTTGCSDDADTCTNADTDTDDDSDDSRLGDFINVTERHTGDISCFEGSLVTESTASGCIERRTLAGQVLDFQEDAPVDEATVEFFWSNDIDGAADDVLTADANGNFTVAANTCEPFTYRVNTDPVLGTTKTTIDTHEVLPHKGAIDPISHTISSVSSVTYALIPTLLGISPDVSSGQVVGAIYDCDGDRIEGAQVVITDERGNIPESMMARYFVDEFPNRSQPHTSDDGLWMLLNVPPGNWVVNGYVADGLGGHALIGKAPVTVLPDSIIIASVFTGIANGVRFPPECKTTCS